MIYGLRTIEADLFVSSGASTPCNGVALSPTLCLGQFAGHRIENTRD